MPEWLQQSWTLPAVGVAAVVLVIIIASRLVRRKPEKPRLIAPDLNVDVGRLPVQPPQLSQPHLEVYGVPVRLAVVVLAPVGRDLVLPPNEQFAELLNQLLPNMQEVVQSDAPDFRRCPAQLSVQGFKHAFFNQVALPGDRGKGTPWCSVAGKFSVGRHSYLVGMVASSASQNSLGQIYVEHEGQWHDAVRVKGISPES